MTAVATDPDDANVVWLAGGTSVWVTDDGGDSWALVLQLTRTALTGRDNEETAVERAQQARDDGEDAQDGDGAPEDYDDAAHDDYGAEYDGEPSDAADDSAALGASDLRGGDNPVDLVDAGSAAASGTGILRMRVIGSRVYICTSRGLWTVDRAARTVGSSGELRFGRRSLVTDVARDAQGTLFIGTARGAWRIGRDGIARIVSSNSRYTVTGFAMVDGRLVAATSRGLFIQGAGGGFDRVGVFASPQRVTDIVAYGDKHLLVAAIGEVRLVRLERDVPAVVERAGPVPGVVRLVIDRNDRVWASGSRGAWVFSEDVGWQRRSDGLLDRRVRDIAAASSGTAHVWIATRAGAARLVSEQAHIYSKRAKYRAKRALKDMPTADDVRRWALETRPFNTEQVQGWVLQERLAWLAPKLIIWWRTHRSREEEAILVPDLGEYVIDNVTVSPPDNFACDSAGEALLGSCPSLNSELRIEARWDLLPAFYAALDGTSSTIQGARRTVWRGEARVRDTVVPLYQTWLDKRVAVATREYDSVRQAIRDILLVQQLEADLYVFTNGRFPMRGAAAATQ